MSKPLFVENKEVSKVFLHNGQNRSLPAKLVVTKSQRTENSRNPNKSEFMYVVNKQFTLNLLISFETILICKQ